MFILSILLSKGNYLLLFSFQFSISLKIICRYFSFLREEDHEEININLTTSYQSYVLNKTRIPAPIDYLNFINDLLTTNYTALVISEKNLAINRKGLISASKIGMFANYLSVDEEAIVETKGKGCQAFNVILILI